MDYEFYHLMNILYNPIVYIHKDYHDYDLEVHNSINNFLILNKYNLIDLSDNWSSIIDPVCRLVINNWFSLPSAAMYIGAYLNRSSLLGCSSLFMTNNRILDFITLPLQYQTNTLVIDKLQPLECYGAAFLIKTVKTLPFALQQRLNLCFPKQPLPEIELNKSLPNSFNLLQMAINYANNFQ